MPLLPSFLVFILISGHTFKKYGELLYEFAILLLQCSRKSIKLLKDMFWLNVVSWTEKQANSKF